MMGKLRSMGRKIDRSRMPVKMVPLFIPLWEGLQAAARDMGVDPITLIHNTLAAGIGAWAKQKNESTLIQVPGRDSVRDLLVKEKARGTDK